MPDPSVAEAFDMDWSVHYSRDRKRVGILVSTFDHCLVDLLWRYKSGELDMEIPFILSNHRDLEPIARMYDIPYHYIFLSNARVVRKMSSVCSNLCETRWIS